MVLKNKEQSKMGFFVWLVYLFGHGKQGECILYRVGQIHYSVLGEVTMSMQTRPLQEKEHTVPSVFRKDRGHCVSNDSVLWSLARKQRFMKGFGERVEISF